MERMEHKKRDRKNSRRPRENPGFRVEKRQARNAIHNVQNRFDVAGTRPSGAQALGKDEGQEKRGGEGRVEREQQ